MSIKTSSTYEGGFDMGTFLDSLSFPARVRKDLGEVLLKKDKEPVFIQCKSCNRRALKQDWKKNYYVCPVCGQDRKSVV